MSSAIERQIVPTTESAIRQKLGPLSVVKGRDPVSAHTYNAYKLSHKDILQIQSLKNNLKNLDIHAVEAIKEKYKDLELKIEPDGIVLVLSGGAGRGIAHAGFLASFIKECVTNNIRIKRIVATSAGSIVASLMLSVYTKYKDNTEELFNRLNEMKDTIVNFPYASLIQPSIRRKSVISPEKIRKLLSDYLEYDNVEDLAIPLSIVVATEEMKSGKRQSVTLSKGPLLDAIIAASAIKPLLPPVKIGDTYFVDGGLSDEGLPVASAVKLKGNDDKLVAVHVGPYKEDLENFVTRYFHFAKSQEGYRLANEAFKKCFVSLAMPLHRVKGSFLAKSLFFQAYLPSKNIRQQICDIGEEEGYKVFEEMQQSLDKEAHDEVKIAEKKERRKEEFIHQRLIRENLRRFFAQHGSYRQVIQNTFNQRHKNRPTFFEDRIDTAAD